MRNYMKPVVIVNSEVSEGVYAASGSADECYTVTAYIHQRPQMGRGDYRIQVNGRHEAADGHHSGQQVLTMNFNQPVTYVSSNGTLSAGDGTSTIDITYTYHNNGNDNIGLGEVIVQSEQGLEVTGSTLSCNHDFGQH